MNVLVNGIGNIGTTLLSLLADYKKKLKIDNIFALKNRFNNWNLPEIQLLQNKGIKIYSFDENFENIDKVKHKINYVFDCTSNGFGTKNKMWYNTLPELIGASAQGSEKNFGVSHMIDINNEIIKNQKFVHIVSCNTHSLASILTTFCNNNLQNLISADFVIVRRSEDIGNHARLVSANVVARHISSIVGTHHSVDLIDLFKTIGLQPDIASSDITTPSQLMHAVRFNIKLKHQIAENQILEKIKQNKYVSTTQKFDSNIVFELGRKYGKLGRLYSHAIFVNNNFMFSDNEIKGWAFIPQEGNTILSTVNAYLYQTNNSNCETIQSITKDLIIKDL
ncbi:MAG: hypothetical protein JXR68_05235 [Bacteroidales bacterium]|nr:hypothetical protein [Bacteroidales bacterium]